MSRLPSIRRRLLFGLLSTAILAWICSAVSVYFSAQHEVLQVYDANLSQAARVLATLLRHEAGEKADMQQRLQKLLDKVGQRDAAPWPKLQELLQDYLLDEGDDEGDELHLIDTGQPAHHYTARIVFRAYSRDGRMLVRSPAAPAFDDRQSGYSDQTLQGKRWRVYTLLQADDGLYVQVAEEMAIREDLIDEMLIGTLWPGLIALPLLGLLIWRIVGRGLRPLQHLAAQVASRHPDSLQPIDDGNKRSEIQPIVDALNRLFERVHKALDNERRFTSNAAHELRTPLAALKVHAQTLQLGLREGAAETAGVNEIIKGVDRTTHLIEQLLAMARVDSEQARQHRHGPVDLRQLVIDVVSEHGHPALAKHIELSFRQEGDARPLAGDAAALSVMLRNLLDNAIRYTPSGGRVDINLKQTSQYSELSVCDDGSGIPPEEQRRLLERFQRGTRNQQQGSGLGLSIVRQVAELHRARLQMLPGLGGKGLCVRLRFAHQND